MAKLEGRDINGMRAAAWTALDVSAVQKMSVPKNCTNEQLVDAVKKMIVEAINTLYGDNKDEKYIKIVNLIMMRVRGALAELSKEVEEKNAENFDADKITEKLSTSLSDLVEKNEKKRDEEHFNKLKEMYDSVMSCIKDQTKTAETSSSESSQSYKPKSAHLTSFDSEWLERQSELSENSFKLLNDMSKQISEGFAKITQLMMSGNVQKNIQFALSSAQQPVNQSVSGSTKKSEKNIKNQIQSLNLKSGLKKLYNTSSANEVDKDSKKKKKKKNQLNDVLTGKQFNLLTRMLNKQFNQMYELENESVIKINKEFSSVNDKLEKLMKKLNKRGFSWTNILLFLMLFAVPLFWTQITNFLKTVNQKYQIDEKITQFINSIDWNTHINNVAGKIWEFVTNKFDKYIKDPINMMIEKTKKTYDACVEWVKDLWKWVTGDDKDGKNKKNEREQLEQKQIKATEEKINRAVGKFENKLNAHAESIDKTASTKSVDINNSIEKTSNIVTESRKTIEENVNKTVDIIENASKDITDDSSGSVADAADQTVKIQNAMEAGVDKAVKAATAQISTDAKEVVESLNKNGAPTKFNDAMMGAMEKAAGQIEQGKDDLAEPNLSKFESIKDYVIVKDASDKTGKGNIIASKSDVNKTLGKLGQKTTSKSVEFIQNAVDLGQFDSNKGIIDKFKNEGTEDEKKQRQAILDMYRKKSPDVKEKISSKVTDETPVEREARWYSSINGAYEAIIKNSDVIQSGLNKNQTILEEIKNESEVIFNDIRESLNVMKEKPKTQETNIGIASYGRSQDSTLDPNMSS